jgi:NAD(P)H-dependent FMN reductase
MSQPFREGALVGSLRCGSHTRKIAQALMSFAPPVDRMAAARGAATFFPPSGGAVSGAEEVAARYRSSAR